MPILSCMKTTAFFLLMLATIETGWAQYRIAWSRIDSGGGSSTGGVYRLKGSAGQPDAGLATGGDYVLSGGFWSIVGVLPTDDTPAIRITLDRSNVILAWPSVSRGFQLEVTRGLLQPNWTDVDVAPTVVGSDLQVTLPLEPGQRFFRLRGE
jgi:hypothetical protein